jgi:hypothetical protein
MWVFVRIGCESAVSTMRILYEPDESLIRSEIVRCEFIQYGSHARLAVILVLFPMCSVMVA